MSLGPARLAEVQLPPAFCAWQSRGQAESPEICIIVSSRHTIRFENVCLCVKFFEIHFPKAWP